ncbi:hypothetical protein XI05_11965 [Bradyrhizobium sp. CCBAU 11357]|nr:hypothetical protein [Bradyrhizobium sp. CCBAU 11357]
MAAIYIATIPRGEPCIVGVSRDLAQTFDGIRDNWPWSEIGCAFWVKGSRHRRGDRGRGDRGAAA